MKVAKKSKDIINSATNSCNIPAATSVETTLPDTSKAAEYIQLAIDELGKMSTKESREAIANLAVILMDIKH